MSFKENLKNESQKEREKLKNMTWRNRIWYIWEYYKPHMLAVAGIFLVIYLIVNVIYRSTFETRLSYAVVNNTSMEPADLESFDQHFKDYMNYGKKDVISSEASLFMHHGDTANQLEYATMAKFSALVASKDLDLMITDQLNIDHYMTLDAFIDLKQLLPDELWQRIEDSVYYGVNSNGQQVPCAIDLNDTFFPEETGVEITPCYVGVISNSVRTDTVISWFRFVLGEP
ncbi:MAG: hypothetical protein HFG49_16340 [Lachnospiraceae bacterium]|jgi:hypothetical protein|nr:hypothetical protein [Lachnospiraceae bacterium]